MNRIMEQICENVSMLKGEQLLLLTIAFRAGATVMGKKPSTILTFTSNQGLIDIWDKFKDPICRQLGLQYYVMTIRSNSITAVLYKEKILKEWIEEKENNKFLKKYYLHSLTLGEQFNTLALDSRMQFPHVIGLYLGIPVPDIEGFVKNSGKNYLFNGYWKVYHNPLTALKIFKTFDYARIISVKQQISSQ